VVMKKKKPMKKSLARPLITKTVTMSMPLIEVTNERVQI
jgi:hypothetical protein